EAGPAAQLHGMAEGPGFGGGSHGKVLLLTEHTRFDVPQVDRLARARLQSGPHRAGRGVRRLAGDVYLVDKAGDQAGDAEAAVVVGRGQLGEVAAENASALLVVVGPQLLSLPGPAFGVEQPAGDRGGGLQADLEELVRFGWH